MVIVVAKLLDVKVGLLQQGLVGVCFLLNFEQAFVVVGVFKVDNLQVLRFNLV